MARAANDNQSTRRTRQNLAQAIAGPADMDGTALIRVASSEQTNESVSQDAEGLSRITLNSIAGDYDNPDGDNIIKFDGIEPNQDGIHLTLIDSKTAMAPKPGLGRVKDTLKRIGMAVDQNNANPKVRYNVYYDFPTEREAARARKIVTDLGYENTITIRVRPATTLGQKLFRKLRE